MIEYQESGLISCEACKIEHCVHRGAFRAQPKEHGGLGLCFLLTCKTVEDAQVEAQATYESNMRLIKRLQEES